jgi:hypothetical protein
MSAQTDEGNTFVANTTTGYIGARNQAVDLALGIIPGRIITKQQSPYWAAPQQMIDNHVSPPSISNQDWFNFSNGEQKSCTQDDGSGNQVAVCQSGLYRPSELAYEETVALGLTETPEYPNDVLWSAQQQLYEKLKANPQDAFNKPILQNFVDSLDNATIGDLQAVKVESAATVQTHSLVLQAENYKTLLQAISDSLKQAETQAETDLTYASTQYAGAKAQFIAMQEAYSAALTQVMTSLETLQNQQADNSWQANAAIQPLLLQEVNQKIVNDVYFSTVAKGIETLTATQLSGLQSIAAQCPYSGGGAVYEARSILAASEHTLYDDAQLCVIQGIAYRQQKPTAENTKTPAAFTATLSPNPASGYAIISTNQAVSNASIELIDVLGRTVFTQVWVGNNTKQLIDLTNIENGLYLLKMKTDEATTTATMKLMVEKR